MSDVLDRFLRYVQIDSQSNPANEEQVPSSACEHEMARILGEDLEEIGCTDVVVDEHAYVTATFAASAGAEDAPALMLCAHMDSASDAPASGIKPHIVHYEGGELFS
ncbi:MAG: peptidase T, partial [Coriobacteriaceae bacterium]|nr:peptidase T [Coriobacteriaceae bacterium]